MPRRYMSQEEYNDQQYYYKHSLKSPQDLQEFLENKNNGASPEEIRRDEKMQLLKERLHLKVREKVEECLTDRQKKVINLYLLSKKQDYMGIILGITQEATHSRLHLAFKRLKKSCIKDPHILDILSQMRQVDE